MAHLAIRIPPLPLPLTENWQLKTDNYFPPSPFNRQHCPTTTTTQTTFLITNCTSESEESEEIYEFSASCSLTIAAKPYFGIGMFCSL